MLLLIFFLSIYLLFELIRIFVLVRIIFSSKSEDSITCSGTGNESVPSVVIFALVADLIEVRLFFVIITHWWVHPIVILMKLLGANSSLSTFLGFKVWSLVLMSRWINLSVELSSVSRLSCWSLASQVVLNREFLKLILPDLLYTLELITGLSKLSESHLSTKTCKLIKLSLRLQVKHGLFLHTCDKCLLFLLHGLHLLKMTFNFLLGLLKSLQIKTSLPLLLLLS